MSVEIRSLRRDEDERIALVAARMRQTLIEVVGAARGAAMYERDWLIDRVRQHLDPEHPAGLDGVVFVAEDAGHCVGHTILRMVADEGSEGGRHGLFSTIYVVPEARRSGLARRLVERGLEWIRGRGAARAATCTGRHNRPLIALFEGFGFAPVLSTAEMVRLEGGTGGTGAPAKA